MSASIRQLAEFITTQQRDQTDNAARARCCCCLSARVACSGLHQGDADKRHAFSSNIAYADSDVAAKTVLQLKLVIGLLYREKRI